MLQVESEGSYVDSSLLFNKNNAETYTYQTAPQALDNFTNNQPFLEPNMVEGNYSTSQQYCGNEGSMVVPADTSLLNNSEVTEDTANLTGEQIFQEAMRFVQEQTEYTPSDFGSSSDYNWETYNALHTRKLVILYIY